jgi:CcmD family protein
MNHLLYTTLLFQENVPTKVTGDVNSGLIYLAVAYGVVWFFIFGYLYNLNRRQARLRHEIDLLKQEATDSQEAPRPEQSQTGSANLSQMGG